MKRYSTSFRSTQTIHFLAKCLREETGNSEASIAYFVLEALDEMKNKNLDLQSIARIDFGTPSQEESPNPNCKNMVFVDFRTEENLDCFFNIKHQLGERTRTPYTVTVILKYLLNEKKNHAPQIEQPRFLPSKQQIKIGDIRDYISTVESILLVLGNSQEEVFASINEVPENYNNLNIIGLGINEAEVKVNNFGSKRMRTCIEIFISEK